MKEGRVNSSISRDERARVLPAQSERYCTVFTAVQMFFSHVRTGDRPLTGGFFR
jgi:hypothetical protein